VRTHEGMDQNAHEVLIHGKQVQLIPSNRQERNAGQIQHYSQV
jgi:hypothetical protein